MYHSTGAHRQTEHAALLSLAKNWYRYFLRAGGAGDEKMSGDGFPSGLTKHLSFLNTKQNVSKGDLKPRQMVISNLAKKWSQTLLRSPFIAEYNTKGIKKWFQTSPKSNLKPRSRAPFIIKYNTKGTKRWSQTSPKGDLKPRQQVISNLAREPVHCKIQHKRCQKVISNVAKKWSQTSLMSPFIVKYIPNAAKRWSQTSPKVISNVPLAPI